MFSDSGKLSLLINWVLAGSLAAVLVRGLLAPTPETWRYGSETGDLVNDLGIAYVAAWFFQLLVVALPNRERERRIHALVIPQVEQAVTTARGLQRAIEDAAHAPRGTFPADEERLQQLCAAIPFEAPSGFMRWEHEEPEAQVLNWGQYLRQVSSFSRGMHLQLAALYPFLPVKTVEVLNAEQHAEFHKHLGLFNAEMIGDTVMSWAASSIADYLSKCSALEDHVASWKPRRRRHLLRG